MTRESLCDKDLFSLVILQDDDIARQDLSGIHVRQHCLIDRVNPVYSVSCPFLDTECILCACDLDLLDTGLL